MELYLYTRVNHDTFNMFHECISNDIVVNSILLSAVENSMYNYNLSFVGLKK